jgi:hypothetical protein
MDLPIAVKVLQAFEYFFKNCGNSRLIKDTMMAVGGTHFVLDYVQ